MELCKCGVTLGRFWVHHRTTNSDNQYGNSNDANSTNPCGEHVISIQIGLCWGPYHSNHHNTEQPSTWTVLRKKKTTQLPLWQTESDPTIHLVLHSVMWDKSSVHSSFWVTASVCEEVKRDRRIFSLQSPPQPPWHTHTHIYLLKKENTAFQFTKQQLAFSIQSSPHLSFKTLSTKVL